MKVTPYTEVIQTFVKRVKMKLKFLSAGGCLQCVKHIPKTKACMNLLRRFGDIPPQFFKMHSLRLNLVLSATQNCYAKDRLWEVCCQGNFTD